MDLEVAMMMLSARRKQAAMQLRKLALRLRRRCDVCRLRKPHHKFSCSRGWRR